MPGPDLTPRQRLLEVLTGGRYTARQLAGLLGLPEREIEDHLLHLVRTVKRDRTRHFIMEPAACTHCAFVFRNRTRLTRPSRCPRCRSEAIADPRYGIEMKRGHS
jgi:predicted Zn-ribbon and HTH transcriptional regulator